MKVLAIAGGRHPYEESTPVLESFLTGAGHEVTVTWEADILADARSLEEFDALIFNTRRAEETSLTEAERNGLEAFVKGGKCFLCIHISGTVTDEWPQFRDITGGGWIQGKSYHPPYGTFTVTVSNSSHPLAFGVSDFVTNDELYMGIDYSADNDVFIQGTSEEGTYPWAGEQMFMPSDTFPLGWTRTYGDGKVFVTLLGHNGLSFETPEFQAIVLNGLNWFSS